MIFAQPANLRRYRTLLTIATIYLAFSFVLRGVLWWRFGVPQGVAPSELPIVFAEGVVNDLVELLYLLAPLSLYLWLLPDRWYRARWQKLLFVLGSYAILLGMFYLDIAEYFFFEEFDSRFNLVAVDYLIYPHEVFINIWDSYPVVQVLIADLLASAVVLALLWRYLRPDAQAVTPARTRIAIAGIHAALLSFAIGGYATDTFAHSENRVTNELTDNGLSSFFRALRTNELNYKTNYRTGDPKTLLEQLTKDLGTGSGTFTRLDTGHLDRRFDAAPGLGKRNVVVIVEESFGAKFIGAYGDTHGLTPEFDALAAHGLLFTNMYASGTRTVRGLEAITLSFPPIPSEAVVKRPGGEHMANWGEVMRGHGYHTSFLYGGYSYFDNMGPFYEGNGFAVSDRSEIENPKFANIWGVSDEDLFRHAVDYYTRIDDSGRPFFSIIMTTSNHKPFTFPDGIPGVAPEGGGRSAGIRYADYALGRFFEAARKQPWYSNTVFVIVADHGARVYGRAQIPLDSYEIPLLIVADGLEPKKVDVLTSQLDIAPTVLGLLGLPYEAPFFGQNVLALGGHSHPLLFNHNHNVALYRDGELAVLGLKQQATTYRYDRKNNTFSELAPDKELIDLATAYFQTAFEQFESHRYVK